MTRLSFETEGGDFEPLPAGRYPATIFETEEGESKAGKPKLKVTYKIAKHHHTGGGRILFGDYSYQPQALWKLKNLLVALDVIGPGFEGVVDFEPRSLQGRAVEIDVTDPDPGYKWNGVEGVYPANKTPF